MNEDNDIYQLEFFKEPEVCRLEAKIEAQKKSQDRMRKGLFARHNNLQKMYEELREEHESFKRALCRGEDDGN